MEIQRQGTGLTQCVWRGIPALTVLLCSIHSPNCSVLEPGNGSITSFSSFFIFFICSSTNNSLSTLYFQPQEETQLCNCRIYNHRLLINPSLLRKLTLMTQIFQTSPAGLGESSPSPPPAAVLKKQSRGDAGQSRAAGGRS